LALTAAQNKEEGYVSVPMEAKELVGKTGISDTVLRLSGKVRVNDKMYDAVSEYGFIEKGEKVLITRYESGQVYVTNVIDKGTATE